MEDLDDITSRRFGSNHDLPCIRTDVLTCAKWECQNAGRCQDGLLKAVEDTRADIKQAFSRRKRPG